MNRRTATASDGRDRTEPKDYPTDTASLNRFAATASPCRSSEANSPDRDADLGRDLRGYRRPGRAGSTGALRAPRHRRKQAETVATNLVHRSGSASGSASTSQASPCIFPRAISTDRSPLRQC